MSDIIMEKGIKEVAVTYTNNDYGKGLADAFQGAFEEAGGTVTISAAHEDGKADYAAEVGALASAGGEVLVVAGYLDQGGKGIIQASLDTGAFDTFVLPDGMMVLLVKLREQTARVLANLLKSLVTTMQLHRLLQRAMTLLH